MIIYPNHLNDSFAKCTPIVTIVTQSRNYDRFYLKKMEAQRLPPTLGALKPHLQRLNLMTCLSKGYCSLKPKIPPLIGNEWELSTDGHLKPVMNLHLPAPKAEFELLKCGCHGDCSSNKCYCKMQAYHALACVSAMTVRTSLTIDLLKSLKTQLKSN